MPMQTENVNSVRRVCLRFSNLVAFTLDGHLLVESASGDYDAVLTCLDIPYLPQGWVPFNLEYAVPPNGMVSSSPHLISVLPR